MPNICDLQKSNLQKKIRIQCLYDGKIDFFENNIYIFKTNSDGFVVTVFNTKPLKKEGLQIISVKQIL